MSSAKAYRVSSRSMGTLHGDNPTRIWNRPSDTSRRWAESRGYGYLVRVFRPLFIRMTTTTSNRRYNVISTSLHDQTAGPVGNKSASSNPPSTTLPKMTSIQSPISHTWSFPFILCLPIAPFVSAPCSSREACITGRAFLLPLLWLLARRLGCRSFMTRNARSAVMSALVDFIGIVTHWCRGGGMWQM